MTTAASLLVDVTLRHVGGFQLVAAQAFPPGITCLLGPSGSGKSSLLAAIAGISRPAEGTISLGDATWFRAPSSAPGAASVGVDLAIEKRRVAFVFQRLALFPHLTAQQNVRYGLYQTSSREAQEATATHLLARLGVSHLAQRKPASYSGGEAQRVALARALAIAPTVMLFDEPFSSLDFELRVALAEVVKQVVAEVGVPAVFVTHSSSEAAALTDRVLYVREGRLTATPPRASQRLRRPTPFPA
ncbi:MAG: ATP-binding cassette domain-containing protein [Myxococcales bacterium]|nr:ATP-binding cassette domain-containing protein [Myxococcales bacterium]